MGVRAICQYMSYHIYIICTYVHAYIYICICIYIQTPPTGIRLDIHVHTDFVLCQWQCRLFVVNIDNNYKYLTKRKNSFA